MQKLKKICTKALINKQQIVLKNASEDKIMSDYNEIQDEKKRDIKWLKLQANITLLASVIFPFFLIALILWDFKGTEKISLFAWPMSAILMKFFLNQYKSMIIEIRCAQKELGNFEEKKVAIYCALYKKKKSDLSMILKIVLKEVPCIETNIKENGQKTIN